jgi:toxin-antitoxin system PIN domain toxin
VTRSLLDVNVLVALLDLDHADHRSTHAWLDEHIEHGWASCAITENGFVRVISQPHYPNPVSPSAAIDVLAEATGTERHEFWPCAVSLLDPGAIDRTRLHGHRQVTDAYLLALAVANGGRLVTLDRSVPLSAVVGAMAGHLTVI